MILGVYVQQRLVDAVKVQEVLTKYGCSIKTRLGLHEVSQDHCASDGTLLLELTGDAAEMEGLEKSLKAIPNLQVQKMSFDK